MEYDLKQASHIGFLVWLIHNFGYKINIPMKDMCFPVGMKPESFRYHIVALEGMGLLSVNRRNRPHILEVDLCKWNKLLTPKM